MKFRIDCVEHVSTEFVVEADSIETLQAWLDGEDKYPSAADIVSMFTQRQTVHDRQFHVVPAKEGDDADHILKEVRDVDACICAEKQS